MAIVSTASWLYRGSNNDESLSKVRLMPHFPETLDVSCGCLRKAAMGNQAAGVAAQEEEAASLFARAYVTSLAPVRASRSPTR